MKVIKRIDNKFCQIDHNFIRSLKVNDYDSISRIYDETMGEDFSNIIYDSHRKSVKKILGRKSKIRCLDIACGTGSFIRRLARDFNDRVECFGIDLSQGQITTARKKAKAMGASVHFSIGDMVAAEYPADCDLITINLDATNHLKHPRHWKIVFEKIRKSLSSGGVFLFDINTPKRLLEDLLQPEVVTKKDITYVQCGIYTGEIDGFALNQHLMQIFHKDKKGIKEYFARIQQIAPSKERLFELLRDAGFSKISEVQYNEKARVRHIFMKNRLFVKCCKD